MKITINISLVNTSGKISWASTLKYKDHIKNLSSNALTFLSAQHCALDAVRSSIGAVKTQAHINIYIDTKNNAQLVHDLSNVLPKMKENEKGHILSINIA